MNRDDVTKIIAADFMYLIFLGNTEIIGKLVDKLNKDIIEISKNPQTRKSCKPQSKSIYIAHDISIPCANILDSEPIQTILNDDAINHIKKLKLSEKKTFREGV